MRRVAASMKASLKRPADLVARYGGEAFALLLPDTDLAGAMAVADAVRIHVLDEAIEHAASAVGHCLTVSLGAAATSHDADGSAGALLKEADTRRYDAKSNGRNQTCGTGRTRLIDDPPAFSARRAVGRTLPDEDRRADGVCSPEVRPARGPATPGRRCHRGDYSVHNRSEA